jgi:gamma-glutamyl-gamma-aminobutyrate hydrolase PuuD
MNDNLKRLKDFTYHILGGHKTFDIMLKREGATPTGIAHADFIFFMGGADVNSQLYGEKPHPRAQQYNDERDRIEANIYRSTYGQFRVGICRGAQLLHVLNGGRLWQHVQGHLGHHGVKYQSENGIVRLYEVSSTHHQMMRPGGDQKAGSYEVWAVADQTRVRELWNGVNFAMIEGHWNDLEIVRYKDTNTLCFQPHPEMINPRSTWELFTRCLFRLVET